MVLGEPHCGRIRVPHWPSRCRSSLSEDADSCSSWLCKVSTSTKTKRKTRMILKIAAISFDDSKSESDDSNNKSKKHHRIIK